MAAIVPILAVAAVLVILVLLAVKIVWSPLRSTVGPRVKQLASVNGSFSYLRVILVALFFLVFGVLFLIGVAIWALVVNIADNWKYYAWAVALIAGAQLAAEYNADIQLGVTEFYVCGFYKVWDDGVLPVMDAVRKVWNALICYWDMVWEFATQVPARILRTLIGCALTNWEGVLDAFANVFVVAAQALGQWINNIINQQGTANLDIYDVAVAIQDLILSLKPQFQCLCQDLDIVWDPAFQLFQSPYLPQAVDGFINAPIQFSAIPVISLVTLSRPDVDPLFAASMEISDGIAAYTDYVSNLTVNAIMGPITNGTVFFVPRFFIYLAKWYDVFTETVHVAADVATHIDMVFNGTDYMANGLNISRPFLPGYQVSVIMQEDFSHSQAAILRDFGCAGAYFINTTVNFVYAPVSIGLQFFTLSPQILTYTQNYDFTPILDSAENGSLCLGSALGSINAPLGSLAQHTIVAGFLFANRTFDIMLHVNDVFDPHVNYLSTVPFGPMFDEMRNATQALGNVSRQFAPSCAEGPGSNETLNFFCCVGDFMEADGNALVTAMNVTVYILQQIIGGADGRDIAISMQTALQSYIIPDAQRIISAVACLFSLPVAAVPCPEMSGTKLDVAFQLIAVKALNVTLIPVFVLNDFIGLFAANQSISISVFMGRVFDTTINAPIEILRGIGALAECFVGTGAGDFFTKMADAFEEIADGFGADVINILIDSVVVVIDFFTGNWDALAEDIWVLLEAVADDVGGGLVVKLVNLAMSNVLAPIVNFAQSVMHDLESTICKVANASVCIHWCVYPFKSLAPGFCNNAYNSESAPNNPNVTTEDFIVTPPIVNRQGDHRVRFTHFDSMSMNPCDACTLFVWTGDTRCDLICNDCQQYITANLSGIAHAEAQECVRLRLLAQQINQNNTFMDPQLLPPDFFYNATEMVSSVANGWLATPIYASWFLNNSQSWLFDTNASSPQRALENQNLTNTLIEHGFEQHLILNLATAWNDVFHTLILGIFDQPFVPPPPGIPCLQRCVLQGVTCANFTQYNQGRCGGTNITASCTYLPRLSNNSALCQVASPSCYVSPVSCQLSTACALSPTTCFAIQTCNLSPRCVLPLGCSLVQECLPPVPGPPPPLAMHRSYALRDATYRFESTVTQSPVVRNDMRHRWGESRSARLYLNLRAVTHRLARVAAIPWLEAWENTTQAYELFKANNYTRPSTALVVVGAMSQPAPPSLAMSSAHDRIVAWANATIAGYKAQLLEAVHPDNVFRPGTPAFRLQRLLKTSQATIFRHYFKNETRAIEIESSIFGGCCANCSLVNDVLAEAAIVLARCQNMTSNITTPSLNGRLTFHTRLSARMREHYRTPAGPPPSPRRTLRPAMTTFRPANYTLAPRKASTGNDYVFQALSRIPIPNPLPLFAGGSYRTSYLPNIAERVRYFGDNALKRRTVAFTETSSNSTFDLPTGLSEFFDFFFNCDFDTMLNCQNGGQGLGMGIVYTLAIFVGCTIVVSLVVSPLGWILPFVWILGFTPVLLWVSYNRSPSCSLAFNYCIGNDTYNLLAQVPPSIPWNTILPGMTNNDSPSCSGPTPSFVNCRDYGFHDGFDTLFFYLRWQAPGVLNYLNTTNLIFFSWIRDISFFGNSMAYYAGLPNPIPDTYVSCGKWNLLSITLPIATVFIIVLVIVVFFAAIYLLLDCLFNMAAGGVLLTSQIVHTMGGGDTQITPPPPPSDPRASSAIPDVSQATHTGLTRRIRRYLSP